MANCGNGLTLTVHDQRIHELMSDLNHIPLSSRPNSAISNISNSESLKNKALMNPKVQAIIAEQMRNNHFLWTIRNFRKMYEEDRLYGFGTKVYTSLLGYQVKVQMFVRDEHLGIYLIILPGNNDDWLEWPFNKRVAFTLLNQTDKTRHRTGVLTPNHGVLNKAEGDKWARPSVGNKLGYGFRKFINTAELVGRDFSSPFLKNNQVFFRIEFL